MLPLRLGLLIRVQYMYKDKGSCDLSIPLKWLNVNTSEIKNDIKKANINHNLFMLGGLFYPRIG